MDYVMALNGNWVDLVIVIMLFFSVWEGFERDLIFGTIDLGGFFLSFIASLKFYPVIGEWLIVNFNLSHGVANAVGFLLAGFATNFLYMHLVHLFYRRIPHRYIQARWNHWLGSIPALGSGIILMAFLLTLVISLPIKSNVKTSILASKLGAPLVSQTQGIEKQLQNVFGEAVHETLTFLTVPSTGQEQIQLHFTQDETQISDKDETIMLTLVNGERALVGRTPLVVDDLLTTLARDHATDMFARGYFSHYTPEGLSPFDRMRHAGISYESAGENLALAPSVQLAHRGLMNSKGHRENILSPDFHKIGIGVVDGGIYGMMFVQEFTD